MAKLPESFRTIESNDDLLEPGDYLAEIIKTELKTTKNGDGQYFAFQFQILGGKSKGRVVFTNINIVNPNPVAMSIAKGTMTKIAKAIDMDPKRLDHPDFDTDEMLKKPMMIVVTKRPDTDAYPGNDIKNYKKASATGTSDAPKRNPFAKKA